MKDKILKLREEGKSYREIQKELGCSKSTISYHCSNSKQTIKRYKETSQLYKETKTIIKKTENFLHKEKGSTRKLTNCTLQFSKRSIGGYDKHSNKENFSYKDVIKKFGIDTKCYLTGRDINLYWGSYHFDHIIPATRGGLNTLDNLGITNSTLNKMKHDLTPDEFIDICKEVLEYNNYKVAKIS